MVPVARSVHFSVCCPFSEIGWELNTNVAPYPAFQSGVTRSFLISGNQDEFQIWFRTINLGIKRWETRSQMTIDFLSPPPSHHIALGSRIYNFECWPLSAVCWPSCATQQLDLPVKMSSYLVVYLGYLISYYTSNGPEKAIKSSWCNELSSSLT